MKTNKEEEILKECEEIIRALAKSMDGQERPQLIVALRSFFAQKLSEVRSEGAREERERLLSLFPHTHFNGAQLTVSVKDVRDIITNLTDEK